MMKQKIKKRRTGLFRVFLAVSCGICLSACGGQDVDHGMTTEESAIKEEQADRESAPEKEEESIKPEEPEQIQNITEEEVPAETDYTNENEESFYEKAEMLEIDYELAAVYYQRLCEDHVFQSQTAQLTGLDIEDLDQNGQPDMVVMVQEGEYYYYGEGCIYFYMNEDKAYCFRDEEYPFFFGFNIISGDFDSDGYVELAFESLGTGVGAAGDWHPRMLKYRNHTMEQMEFPCDETDGSIPQVSVMVTQEAPPNRYSAYCAYLDETITFEVEDYSELEGYREQGANARGYFNLWKGEYEGGDALEVSEYLYAGGIGDGVGLAKFLIVWDQEGKGRIVRWWIEAW